MALWQLLQSALAHKTFRISGVVVNWKWIQLCYVQLQSFPDMKTHVVSTNTKSISPKRLSCRVLRFISPKSESKTKKSLIMSNTLTPAEGAKLIIFFTIKTKVRITRFLCQTYFLTLLLVASFDAVLHSIRKTIILTSISESWSFWAQSFAPWCQPLLFPSPPLRFDDSAVRWFVISIYINTTVVPLCGTPMPWQFYVVSQCGNPGLVDVSSS